jgi:hypothetical protein
LGSREYGRSASHRISAPFGDSISLDFSALHLSLPFESLGDFGTKAHLVSQLFINSHRQYSDQIVWSLPLRFSPSFERSGRLMVTGLPLGSREYGRSEWHRISVQFCDSIPFDLSGTHWTSPFESRGYLRASLCHPGSQLELDSSRLEVSVAPRSDGIVPTPAFGFSDENGRSGVFGGSPPFGATAARALTFAFQGSLDFSATVAVAGEASLSLAVSGGFEGTETVRLTARLLVSDDWSVSGMAGERGAFIESITSAAAADGKGSGSGSAGGAQSGTVIGVVAGILLMIAVVAVLLLAWRRPWKRSAAVAYDIETEFQEEQQTDDGDDDADDYLPGGSADQMIAEEPANLRFDSLADESSLFIGF